jgi:methyl-accepting chemotaxis protein
MEYMQETDIQKRAELKEYIDGLKAQYDERHEFWIECEKDNKISNTINDEFLINSYKAADTFYDVFYNKMVPAVESGNNTQIDSTYQELKEAYTQHREAIDKVVVLANAWSTEIEQKADRESRIYYGMVIIIMIMSIISGYFYSIFMSRSIIYEVENINSIMDKVSKGDLSVKVEESVKTKDEFGELALCIELTLKRLNDYSAYINEIAAVLAKMAQGCMKVEVQYGYEGEFAKVKVALLEISKSLYDTLTQINSSADKVSSDSENVSKLSVKLSDGANNQASIIEEMLASIEQIDDLVKENVKGAIHANEKVKEVTQSIQYGNNEMEQLLSAMSEIKASSTKIEEITNTITEISSRTNLLALNASIEAARAGEEGRGFAIVAEQVGELAKQSADSAQITAKLIHEAIEDINNGVILADNTSKALSKVVTGAQEITQIMSEIENTSKTQSESISQMADGVDEIAGVVENNVQSAAISEKASGNLLEEVIVLRKLVNKFEL